MTNTRSGVYIAQHNALINARFTMGPLQMRLFLNLLTQVSPEDEDFKPLFVPTEKLIMGRGGSSYEALEQMCTDIASFVATIEVLEEGTRFRPKKPIRRNIPFMAEATYRADLSGVIACFNPLIKPYLLQLHKIGNFTIADIREVLKLKSPYAVRIYMLLLEHLSFGKRTVTIEHLRYVLGIEEDQYPKLANFRARVLNDAQKQIASTNVPFTYELIKQGRKTTSVEFTFPKGGAKLSGGSVPELGAEWATTLSKLELTPKSIALIAQQLENKEYDLGYIDYVIRRAAAMASTGKVKRRAGQIHSALKEKYWLEDYKRSKVLPKPKNPSKALAPATPEIVAYRLSEIEKMYNEPGVFLKKVGLAPTFEEHLQRSYYDDGFELVEQQGEKYLVKR